MRSEWSPVHLFRRKQAYLHLRKRDVNAHNNLHGAQIHCQDHAGWSQRPAAPGNDSRPRSRSPETSIGSPFGQNPLADNDYTFAEMNGRFWYMGPSSSWSFCRRVFALLGKRLPASSYEHALDPGHFDGGAFNLRWRPLAAEDTPDVSNLPPFDVAHFLFNTAKFYLGTIFQIIDEQEFLHNMHELYEDAATKATSSRHWYAQYLLILAYGKASIASQRDSDGGPPGHQYASRAMALMPDMSGLAPNASHAVQALVLGALYLQSIDMRISALQHLGHALRMAIIEGWHRHMPEDVVGAKHSHRCNIIFWMVYMLDREFGPLMGNPSSIRDEDITAKSPSEMDNSLEALNLTLHIRLARLMAQIITQIYGVGKEFDGTLVVNTQKVLRQLARLSKDLTNLLNTYFQGSVNRASRMALRLILAYHHCVVLTTRPLVMCALHKHIRQTDALRSGRISLSPPVAYLLQSCIDSAQSVLKTLRVIGEEDLLEAFLPFQLEDAFSSAFILYIVRAVNPGLVQDESWRDDIDSVLDNMISKGSVVAPLRKKELSQLEYIVGVLTPRTNEYSVPPMTVAETQPGDDEPPVSPVMTQTEDTGWDFIVADDAMGLSPDHLLDLAAQLGLDPNFNCL
ncbi:hypothetical protein N3K66_001421 [Trichothecium roseum]|uniref:Uncharacterized protein n=1 Tax=Trichothecium roseum TaxID=47278 RepID=A0ACC0VEU7_9HYPO|nr:hypothetical protein N3K66_001421 [Trichothecium roseum]